MKAFSVFLKTVGWGCWALWLLVSLWVVFMKPSLDVDYQQSHNGSWSVLEPDRTDATVLPPSAPSTKHLWGTDEIGRDVLSRLLFGSGYSLLFGGFVAFFTCLLGLLLGIALSFLPSTLKHAANSATELLSSLPLFPLALIGLSFYPGQVFLVGLLKVFLGWGTLAQLVRIQTDSSLRSPLLQAARSQGLKQLQIFFRYLIPTVRPVVFAFFPLVIFSSILSLAALDFFGLGFPIPTPTLSELFHQYSDNRDAWWLLAYPLIVTSGLLFGIHSLSNRFSDQLDPRERYQQVQMTAQM
ncbi:MAG: ABC transporter permease [Proteobacteria bacterium]|nr:ABC transporter permease [Pseudomonadota bacterium]NDC24446.1 ABC transporter permease [Pseudomonadota bacterium]NDD04616.1 ABC transporter permease [Pseudomonadota bacterium]NDG25633.1 ABC transporter permease [Pseudomonadota bacterium]